MDEEKFALNEAPETEFTLKEIFGRPEEQNGCCLDLMQAIADQMAQEGKAGQAHMTEYRARVALVRRCPDCPLADTCLNWRQRQAVMEAQQRGAGLGPLFGSMRVLVLKYSCIRQVLKEHGGLGRSAVMEIMEIKRRLVCDGHADIRGLRATADDERLIFYIQEN